MNAYVKRARSYARKVVRGTIPACSWIRAACQRQIDDLARKDWEWHFDEDRAAAICEFVELLPHVEGRWRSKNIELEDWQCFMLTTIFGWINDEGIRRYRKALVIVPRRNSKTTTAACIALFLLLCDGEPGAQVYSAATTRDQAKISWKIAKRMVERTPELRESFGVEALAHSITAEHSGSYFQPLSRDADTLEGLSVHGAIIDELHAHKTREVFDVLDEATGSRKQPLIFIISTEGDNATGVFAEQRAYAENVLNGTHVDENFFSVIYTIDGGPHDIPFRSVDALKKLEELCNSKCVQSTQISQFWQEACASNAITGGGPRKIPGGAVHTRTGESGLAECAAPATNSTSSTETPNERKEAAQSGRNGPESIRSESRPTWTDGGSSRKISANSEIEGVSYHTESREGNTTLCLRRKEGNAPSAGSLKSTYASITATLRDVSEDCSADNAMRQSAFSETLKRVYSEHSPTCSARALASVSDDGVLLVHQNGDDWTDRSCWAKANPNMGVSLFEDDLRIRCNQAQKNPASQSSFLTKRLNIRVGAGEAYFNMLAWEHKCKDATLRLEDFYGQPCQIYLDLASESDIAAKVMLFRRDDLYYVFGHWYLPKDTAERGNPNYDIYRGWADAGLITLTPGGATDFEFIEREFLEDVQTFQLNTPACDPFQATYLATRMQAQGIELVKYGASRANFSEAMKHLGGLVLAGKIKHNGDPVLTWMMGNVMASRDAGDRVYPRKARNENKIDGAVALIGALGMLHRMQPVAAPGVVAISFGA